MTWWPLLLGWPAIALSAVLSVAGFQRCNEYLVLAAILPILPVGFYILGSPYYWWVPIVILCGLLIASWTIRRARNRATNSD